MLAHLQYILALIFNDTPGGLDKTKKGTSQRRLAASRFSHDTEGLTPVHVKAHILHSPDVCLLLEKPLLEREPLGDTPGFEHSVKPFVAYLEELDLTYIFISHDLSVIEHICDRVLIMYLGHVMELAETEELFNNPLHPYTQALLSAIPQIDKAKRRERMLLEQRQPRSH